MTTFASKFELHYFLVEDSHKMNASIRNKCEQELLNLFNEVALQLGVSISIESEAYSEGGLKEVWSFIGKNSNQLTILLLALTLLLSRIPTTDEEYEELKKQETILSIEERKLKIKKLKEELNEGKEIENHQVVEAVEDLDSHIKILKYKSNFYNNLVFYERVTAIGASRLDESYQPLEEKKIVDRKDFPKFILITDELKPVTDEDAKIEIISPVLKDGNYKWRGIYNNEPISFYMKDKEFKNKIIRDGVQFKNGSFIDCVLDMERKINNAGEVCITSHSVDVVVRKYDDMESIVTPQGKKYFKNKKALERQMTVFDYKK